MRKAVVQKERLTGQVKRKCSVVSKADLHKEHVGSGGVLRRLCRSSPVAILSWRTRYQVFLAFSGMRRDQNIFHLEGDRIFGGIFGGEDLGRDLKPLVEGAAI